MYFYDFLAIFSETVFFILPVFFNAEKFRFVLFCFQQIDQQHDACQKHDRPLRTREIFDERGKLIEHVRQETRHASAQDDGLVRRLGRKDENN